MLLLVAGGALLHASPAAALEPKPDYWYTETIEVDTTHLPPGVEIHTSDPSRQPRSYLVVTNANASPVYVMSLGYKDVLVMTTPDPGWKSRVAGAQEAASYLVAPNRPAHLNIEALTDLDHELKDSNVLSIAPPPDGQTIPEAQSSELLLVYNDQVIEVPFTLSYMLNAQFDNGMSPLTTPIKTVQATDPVRLLQASEVMLLISGLAAALFLAWLVQRGLRIKG
jgi:hypothetical protein